MAKSGYERYGAQRLIILGTSLGTGVAVALAARREAGALVLLAPFLSAMDIAARRFPFLPVRWLMRDPFRSDLWIPRVRVPLLVIHGESDPIIPISSGKRLFGLANEPKTFISVPGGGHIVLCASGVFAKLCDWLDGVFTERGAAPSPSPRDGERACLSKASGQSRAL